MLLIGEEIGLPLDLPRQSLPRSLSFMETCLLASSAPQVRVTHFEDCISIFIDLKPMLELVTSKKVDFDNISSGKENETPSETFLSLLHLTKSRVQSILLSLTKLCLAKGVSGKDRAKGEAYKSCYGLSLKLNEVGDSSDELTAALLSLISQIDDKSGELRKNS